MIWDLKQYGDNTAIIDGDSEYTYSEFAGIAEDIVSHIPGRSLICIFTKNCTASVAGYIGSINAGIVPMLLDTDTDDELAASLIGTYRPSYMWLPQDMRERFADRPELYSCLGYVLLDMQQQAPREIYPELGLLITTSGSTGSPKLVRQSYRNIESNLRSIIEYLGIGPGERAITSLPMNYVYGLSVIHSHLYAGACLVLTEATCYSKAFWNLVTEKEVTSFAGVPFMYEMLNKLRITKKNYPSLVTYTQAGGKLSAELQDVYAAYAAENGKRFFVMYGASEATSRMSYLPYQQAVTKRGSIGIPIPGGRFEIIDADGAVITEPEKVGELVYYGDNVTLGYSEKGEDLALGDERHGRLLTGDMAYVDADGYYYIAGRKKRFIKMLGKRINLEEVEKLLKSTLDSIDIATGGRDDLLAVYVTDAELKDAAHQYVVEKFGVNPALCKVKVIDEIPKNNSGKVLYSKLADIEL